MVDTNYVAPSTEKGLARLEEVTRVLERYPHWSLARVAQKVGVTPRRVAQLAKIAGFVQRWVKEE